MNKKIKNLVCNLDIGISAVMLVSLILLTFCGVFRRYVFRSPIIWMEEVQMILFVWVIFLAAGAAFRVGGHIAIEIVVDSLPKKLRTIVGYLDIVLQLTILSYLLYQGCVYYLQLVNASKVTTLLRVPYSVAYAALPIGCLLMLISYVISEISGRMAPKKEKEMAEL